MLLPWHVLRPLITDTLVAEEQEASQPNHFHFGVFWLGATLHEQETAQASLLRLPICFFRGFFPGREKAKWFRLNGPDFQFGKQFASQISNCFLQPGNNQRRRGSSPQSSAYKSSALSIRPRLSEKIAFSGFAVANWMSRPLIHFAFPGSDFQFAFSGPEKKQNGSDFQFAFSRAGEKKKAKWLRLPICFLPSREKAKWSRLPICFFPGREKAKGSREKAKWSRLPICFFPGLEKQRAQTSNLLFPGPGKSKMVQTSNLLSPGPGKSKMVQTSNLLFPGPGKSKRLRLPICFFTGREKAKWF